MKLLIGVLPLMALLWAPYGFCTYYNIAESSQLSYEKLEELISENGLNTVEKTLEKVKSLHPEFFKNYLLMYHSRSLQGSSFANPRAILFDRSGHFVFSFNGHKTQRGFDRLEIMQFRDDEHRFEFREVIFSPSGVKFSEPNPAKCMACHQDVSRKNIDPRPNWEPYNIWPGAFGSNSGRLETRPHELKTPRFQRMDSLTRENLGKEKEKLEEFFDTVHAEHPRYKLLDRESFNPRFTVEITQMFANLNFRRVARIITEEWAEVYEYLEPAVWGVAKCQKLMVTPETYEWIKMNWPKPEYHEEEIYLSHPPLRSEKEILNSLKMGNPGDLLEGITKEELKQMARASYLRQFEVRKGFLDVDPSRGLHHLFEPLGISTADWSMDFKTDGRLAFRERFGVPANTKTTFYDAMRLVTKKKIHKTNCKELGVQAVANFEKLRSSELFQELMERKRGIEEHQNSSILGRCVKCHTSDDAAIPYISFDNPEKLKSELVSPVMFSERLLIEEIRYRLGDFVKEADRMPMGPIATKTQRENLIEYLESLGSVDNSSSP